jgi:Tol biopolymer transport system component
MSERQQMALKIAGLIAVAGLMGLVLYFMIFKGGPTINPQAPDDETPDTSGGLPTAGEGVPGSGSAGEDDDDGGPGTLTPSPVANGGLTATTLLTTAGIFQPTITSSGTIAYYDPRDGKFYTIDDNGNVVLLSQGTFPFAENVVFSDDAASAVIEFPDGSNVVYDFTTGIQHTLPSHWEEFSFSSDSTEIATKSVGTDPSNRTLVITSADGSNARAIAPLGANDSLVEVDWSPDGNIVGFSRTGASGSAFGQNEIYLIGEDGEAAGVLIVNGSNFKSIWSPDGANILYSIADAGDDYRASLWYGDSRGDRTGDTRLRLSLKTTVDKCVFASASLAYCAVPLEMPAGGGSASSLIDSPDYLYSIDLPSGRTTLVAIPDLNQQMFNLSLSSDGDQLFFTDGVGRLGLMQLD